MPRVFTLGHVRSYQRLVRHSHLDERTNRRARVSAAIGAADISGITFSGVGTFFFTGSSHVVTGGGAVVGRGVVGDDQGLGASVPTAVGTAL